MLNLRRERGVTLIELMVTVAILAFVLAAAVPNFSNWMAGSRIRATAESVLAGLQYAKSEATTRNTQVRFQFTTSLDATCARSTSSANWVVDVVDADATVDSVETKCNLAASDTAPSILQKRAAGETGSSGNTVVSASASQTIFNGFGRQVPVTGTTASTVTIDIRPTAASQCAASGGKVTCLRVVVSPSGQIRMCNPVADSGDSQSC